MRLGKLAPEFSDRDLKFSSLMRAVVLPPAYDWDAMHPGIPTPMFGNDAYGDCVMAGRAHQTLRFEMAEQNKLIPITDKEVEAEYFKETGGADSGLVVSRSLKSWRNLGWAAGGSNYKIKGYSRLDLYNRTQVKTAMFSDLGMGIGFSVPQSAIDQFNVNHPWTVVADDGGSVGGHYVYCVAYDSQGLTCVTWAKRQQMTWEFFDKYTDEAWAIFDAKDDPHRKMLLKLDLLDDFLKKL
jgi:hypothetical protein